MRGRAQQARPFPGCVDLHLPPLCWEPGRMVNTNPASHPPRASCEAPHEELLQNILASRHFKQSPRLRDFLTYICDRAFADQLDGISEQQIAVHVFGRPPDYNPGEDTIVRSAARQLRQKLELYNLGDGAESAWRLHPGFREECCSRRGRASGDRARDRAGDGGGRAIVRSAALAHPRGRCCGGERTPGLGRDFRNCPASAPAWSGSRRSWRWWCSACWTSGGSN
jgi:hypothetical protein